MISPRCAALVVAFLLGSTPATGEAQANFNPSSPEELRALGRSILAEEVSSSGRDLNPVWRKDVSMIIDSVHKAAAYRAHPVRWEIIGDSSINASALPGGVMIINVGLPVFCTDVGEHKFPRDAAKARREYIGCLAAVIGHEFGHLALGHSDSVAATTKRRREIARRSDAARGIVGAVRDTALMGGLRLERARELEADEAGALYLLRSGWEVQDAINLHMSLDSVSREEGDSQGQLTWLEGHPRSSERAALLEGRRARIKLLQRDLDDALSLIRHDVLPDSALAMLNRVLTDLPYLAAAKHARAVLLARRWLATASVSDLKVRPTMSVYDAQFMASIRGGDANALRLAREAFRSALTSNEHPYTLANLAVLDAYAGDSALARRRAETAAARMPNDAEVQNNLGVVHFVAGRIRQARAAFDRAETLLDEDLTPAVAFNVARAALAAGDRATAIPLLEQYAAYDESTAWGKHAAQLARDAAGTRTPKTTEQVPTASSGSTPNLPLARAPLVAGIALGTPAAQLYRALGAPGERDTLEYGVMWQYPKQGVYYIVGEEGGVLVACLYTAAAGSIAGVRVGDGLAAALRILGPITERERDGNEQTLSFDRGEWQIVVHAVDGVVDQIGLRTS